MNHECHGAIKLLIILYIRNLSRFGESCPKSIRFFYGLKGTAERIAKMINFFSPRSSKLNATNLAVIRSTACQLAKIQWAACCSLYQWFFAFAIFAICKQKNTGPVTYMDFSWFGRWKARARPRRRWWASNWLMRSSWPARMWETSISWSDTGFLFISTRFLPSEHLYETFLSLHT